MNFTPEVVAALAVLRNAAENDFERHRLDVLERDLTSPPVVEVIDETHQKFDGVIFLKSKSGHYLQTVSIHRAVWSYNYGEPTSNEYDVHHIDKDKANNNISNLQLLTKSEHRKIHTAEQIEKICPVCGEKFYVIPARKKKIYCSYKCAATLPRKPRQANKIEKICPVCQKAFLVFPSQERIVCCSLSCAKKLDWEKKPKVIRTCSFCKKEFIVHDKSKNKKYCSRQCYFESKRSKK